MMSIKEALTDTTSSDKGKLIFDKEVIETAICGCGREFEKEYKTIHKDVVRHHKTEKCFICNISDEDDKIEEEFRRQRIIDEAKYTFKYNSLLNEKLKLATFENYEPTNEELTKAKEICQRYAKNFNNDNPVSLLLIGNYGTGKSHLAASITKELVKKGVSSIFISTPKLLSKLRSTYNKGSDETEEKILNQLMRVRCLVIDDIGAEQTKKRYDENEHDWSTSKIFELIDSRIGKHTIYTSNFKPNELQERLGGRNFSRMMEGTHVIKMNGEDYRLKDFK